MAQASDFTIEQLQNGNYAVKGLNYYQDIDFVNGGFITTNQRATEIMNLLIEQINSSIPTLVDVQETKIAQINDLYSQKLATGFTSSASGTALTYGYAATDQMKFMQVALEVLLSPTTAFPVTIHPKDGSSVTLDQTQYNQLVSDIAAFAKPLDAKQHDYITQVNTCTTVDAVNAIVVSF